MEIFAQSAEKKPKSSIMDLLEEQVRKASQLGSGELKQRIAVRSPQGGYRMEVRVIKKPA